MSDVTALAAEQGMQAANSAVAEAQGRDLALLRKRLASDPDPKAREQKLREACQGFEAIFMRQLWSQMRATVSDEGYLHSKEEKQYRDMYDQELMNKLSKSGGIGLGDMLFNQLKKEVDKAGRHTAPSNAPAMLKQQAAFSASQDSAESAASGSTLNVAG